MLFCTILLFLAAGASARRAPEVDCSILQVAACAFLVDADRIDKHGLAETEEVLDSRCKQSQPILKCFNDFAVRCPGGELQHLKQFFIDEYATYNQICDKNTNLSKMYLRNAKCLNKYRKAIQRKCGQLFQFEESENLSKELCMKYAQSFQCAIKDIENSCGKEALQLEKEIFTPVTTLMDSICNGFQYSSSLKQLPAFINSIKFPRSLY